MKLKMWIGNLDGVRQGLVIASSKARALKIVGRSRSDFDAYWTLRPLDPHLEPETLYTRPFRNLGHDAAWTRGRCPVEHG